MSKANTVGSRQRETIIGTLLGDGFLEKNGKDFRLICGHSARQKEYVEWKRNQLELKCSVKTGKRFDSRTNKFYEFCILRTETHPIFREFHVLFYQKGKREIPKQLSRIITPRILAIWIMDDGYKRSDCNALRLNTQSYSLYHQKLIQRSLKGLGIESSIQSHKDQFVIYIPSSSMDLLRSIISPYIIPSMKYKIA